MARTDALAAEGLDAAIARAVACVKAGADAVFPEAVPDLVTYRKFADAVGVPILANLTEFGMSPLFTVSELRSRQCRDCALSPFGISRDECRGARGLRRTSQRRHTERRARERCRRATSSIAISTTTLMKQTLDRLFAKDKDQ